MYEQKISAYFDDPACQSEILAAITRLCAIRSVREDAQPGMPFGPGPAKALAEALTLCQELGFQTRDYEGYVGTADLNDHTTALHILGHLDVVGEGTGWTVTEPYTPKLVDGLLYGRGVSDDKGPIVAALFAMKAVRDLELPLTQNARLILGTDEESGSEDIAYYFAKEPYAPFTFSPDAEFPLINIEKGSYKPTFTRTWTENTSQPRVRELSGGFRINVLPPESSAVVEGLTCAELEPFCQASAARTGAIFTLTEDGVAVHIQCDGKGAHASTPEDGNNAITALLDLLCALPLAESDSQAALHSLHHLFPHGDTVGKALGIAQVDEVSGALSLAFSLLEVTPTGLSGRFDARVPICANQTNCKDIAQAAFAAHGFTSVGEMGKAHHTPADSPIVKTLLGCYERYTGSKGMPLSIGGGTYVHDIPGGVAFGCGMPGFSPNMHGANEKLDVKDLFTSCKIFTQAILELCT